MSVIILLAVGSDYNLLLVSRFKEEIHAGINTGIIRSMGGTGSVVTSAGLVFAFTMMSMVVSDLRVVGQVGTTIGLGLLFDTLVIRSFMTPSIAALLGRWFWWPQRVRNAGRTVAVADTAPAPGGNAGRRRRRRPCRRPPNGPDQIGRHMKSTRLAAIAAAAIALAPGVRRACTRRPRYRFRQRTPHLWHLWPEGLQRVDRQDHL